MKLVIDTPNYFEEMGRIVSHVESLRKCRIEVVFEKDGMRLTETYGKGVRTNFYHTAAELRAYLHGLEDGFWHAVRVDQALFTDGPIQGIAEKQGVGNG